MFRMRALVVAILATLGLHFAWEMLQAPAFIDFAGTTWEGTVRCLAAAVGDLLLAGGAYVVTALAFRRAAWPVLRGWILPALTWIALGVLATIGFERWALSRGRWSYGPEMPVLVGIGLLPLLQWLVVPALTLLFVHSEEVATEFGIVGARGCDPRKSFAHKPYTKRVDGVLFINAARSANPRTAIQEPATSCSRRPARSGLSFAACHMTFKRLRRRSVTVSSRTSLQPTRKQAASPAIHSRA